ncbi:MAG: SAM-dependent methyltransferase [Bacteroidetes bacterium RBG_13_42_15]|nr:MAG: SAM-dependent methyltransferase [Bacteroidetes bacterium RBG_13_42_15]
MGQWYEELFRDYAGKYEKESFTAGTAGEVDFIEKELNHNKSAKILDIGCGTGRHSLELARRGYLNITGLDLSESMLKRAKDNAKKENLRIEFIKKDARDFNFNGAFDLAIMMCEGAFPLMETDEMNFSILKNAVSSLMSGGKFIFTTLNGLYPLFHSVKDFINSESIQGETMELNFDLMTFRYYSVYETEDDNSNKKVLNCNERYYVPSEITWLLKSAGFSRSEIFGCKMGAFSRNDKLTTEDFEMLVVAEK